MEQTPEQKRLSVEFTERIMDLMGNALGLVAALAWNDAFQSLFKIWFGEAGSILVKFFYAIVITILVLLMSHSVMRLLTKVKGTFTHKT